jgi:dolichyl-phosphate mannosyltransferase polypeptide 3
VYLAVFMELVSFPDKIQKEIVPVVRSGLPPARGVETHPL